MKRYYSPSSYRSKDIPSSDLLTQTVRPSINIRSSTNLQLPAITEVKKKVGRYYYLQNEQIGKGYTSSVYKAYSVDDINLSTPRQTYAIKVMPLNTVNPSSLELLQNQIEIIKLVDHPNVIKCYDIYKSKTHCYIITEYCSEGCLMDLINKNKSAMDRKISLPQEKVIDITQQIIEGLKYLFQKGIIHRDIKPANILKGKNGWKIADFGFAIFSDTEIKSKFNVGTPLYMPIESLKDNLYSPESDVFSVGIILYELLTGRTPWQSKSEKQLIRKMQLIPMEDILSKNKIQSELLKVILKLCSSKKRSRMGRQQFMSLEINKFIQQKKEQSQNYVLKNNWSKQLKSIRSQVNIQRRLKPIKSMDQFAFLNERQKFNDKNDKLTNQNVIVEQGTDKRSLYKAPSLIVLNSDRYQAYQDPSLKYFGSKQQIYKSLKYKYLDLPQVRPSLCLKNDKDIYMKKNVPRVYQQLNVKSSPRIDSKRQIKNEDRTRCTQDKESETSINPEDYKYSKEELKYIDEVSHILINQVHFCRFLFYLYKNSLYVLLGKKSQDKLAVLIFQMIFSTLDDLTSLQLSIQRLKNKSIPSYFKDKLFRTYLKSQKHEMIRKTIKQYKEKYEKEFVLLKIKLGQNLFDQIEMESKNCSLENNKQQGSQSQLVYVENELKKYLKEFDHNLHLTIDTISTSQRSISSPRYVNRNGFIFANIQGIKNLYQFYKLINLMVQTDKDMLRFQKKSKIKVTTDYAKSSDCSYEELKRIRDLIRSL